MRKILSTTSTFPIYSAFYSARARPKIPAAPTMLMTRPPVATGAPPVEVEVEVSEVFDVAAVEPEVVVLIVDDDNEDEVIDEPEVAVDVTLPKEGTGMVATSESYTA